MNCDRYAPQNLDDLLNENWLNTFKDDLKYIT